MLRTSALALLGAMTFTTAAQIHAPLAKAPVRAPSAIVSTDDTTRGKETIGVYYTPLDSTEVARWVGLGKAYHMALVYTDSDGISHGASSGPSDLSAAQTPSHALSAIFASFDDRPSAFGTLVSDPANDTPFVKDGRDDHYTRDEAGRAYPQRTVVRGGDLSARWASILHTYVRVGAMKLTYSPVTQNSNSVAATALREAGVPPEAFGDTLFVPGAFTRLP